MQALIFDRVGEPADVLRVAEVADPTLADDVVLVRVTARPIHPADLAFIRGAYRLRPNFPQVAGLEGCGEVIASPPGNQFRAGMRVAFRYPGAWAEFAAVPIDRLMAVPDDIAQDQACQISLNPVTAWALLEESNAKAGDAIVMTAATSVVSNLIAQMARSRGIYSTGVVRGDASEAKTRVASDWIISVAEPDLANAIAGLVEGKPVAAILDSVGGPLIGKLMGSLSSGSSIVAYGVQDREPAAITNAMLIYANLTWKGFGIDRWLSQQAADAKTQMFSEIWTMIRNDTIALPVHSRHRFVAFRDALAADAKPGRVGKVVLI